MINEKVTKEKLDFYKGKNIKVHISKTNREFLNGLVVGKESESVYIIREEKFGLIHIFVGEIFDIEEFREDNRI